MLRKPCLCPLQCNKILRAQRQAARFVLGGGHDLKSEKLLRVLYLLWQLILIFADVLELCVLLVEDEGIILERERGQIGTVRGK